MPYKPWCPKCRGTLFVEESLWGPVVACRCGFRLVDQNHIKNFVMEQEEAYNAHQETKRGQSDLHLEETRKAEQEAARLESERIKTEADEKNRRKAEDKAKKLLEVANATVQEFPQPTAAQRKQGYTRAVHCAVCGSLVWRRKGAVGKGGPFFCCRPHQTSYFNSHPRGGKRGQTRSTG